MYGRRALRHTCSSAFNKQALEVDATDIGASEMTLFDPKYEVGMKRCFQEAKVGDGERQHIVYDDNNHQTSA